MAPQCMVPYNADFPKTFRFPLYNSIMFLSKVKLKYITKYIVKGSYSIIPKVDEVGQYLNGL